MNNFENFTTKDAESNQPMQQADGKQCNGRFAMVENTYAAKTVICTRAEFWALADSPWLAAIFRKIDAAASDEEKNEIKRKELPALVFVSTFDEGAPRKECFARPSGMDMLDIDDLASTEEAESEAKRIIALADKYDILYVGITPKKRGLRLVFECPTHCSTLEEAQMWLAGELGVVIDEKCKDFARCSYAVPRSHIRYINEAALFEGTPKAVYENKAYNPEKGWAEVERKKAARADNAVTAAAGVSGVGAVATGVSATGVSGADAGVASSSGASFQKTDVSGAAGVSEGFVFHGSDAFPATGGGAMQTHFRGIALEEIGRAWLRQNGGEPEGVGERNTKLHKLTLFMRYITDFNEQVLLAGLPRYGLEEREMKTLIHSAVTAERLPGMPKKFAAMIEAMVEQKQRETDGSSQKQREKEQEFLRRHDTSKVPLLPPLFQEYYDAAPSDFKVATLLSLLPILGTLGSRLRAVYLDGKVHSPSFLVMVLARQASGKSFMVRLVEECLERLIAHDDVERQKEQEYNEKMAELQQTNRRTDKKEAERLLGEKPETLIRMVPPTMSLSQMLKRMSRAQHLHLFAYAPEIDTLVKAWKKDFSNYSDALRCAFDNDRYGQDYANINTYSGVLRLYYNMLLSGTPDAMARLLKNQEDGLASRMTIVTLPDQFGKPMPIWKKMDEGQKKIVEQGLRKLDEVTIVNDQVQMVHEMQMEWLGESMNEWCLEQQAYANMVDDRDRDTFMRRSSVVGFRAGMIAWFLWSESEASKGDVERFSRWIATLMLNEQLCCFGQEEAAATLPYKRVYKALKKQFTRDELQSECEKQGITTTTRDILWRWKKAGMVEPYANKSQLIEKKEV